LPDAPTTDPGSPEGAPNAKKQKYEHTTDAKVMSEPKVEHAEAQPKEQSDVHDKQETVSEPEREAQMKE